MSGYYAFPLAFVIGFAVHWCYASGSTPSVGFGLAKAACTACGSLIAYYWFYR